MHSSTKKAVSSKRSHSQCTDKLKILSVKCCREKDINKHACQELTRSSYMSKDCFIKSSSCSKFCCTDHSESNPSARNPSPCIPTSLRTPNFEVAPHVSSTAQCVERKVSHHEKKSSKKVSEKQSRDSQKNKKITYEKSTQTEQSASRKACKKREEKTAGQARKLSTCKHLTSGTKFCAPAEAEIIKSPGIKLSRSAGPSSATFRELQAPPSWFDSAEQRSLQKSFLGEVNMRRQSLSLPPLTLNPILNKCAAKHNYDQAFNMDGIYHRGSDGSKLSDRLKRVGYPYKWAGENLAHRQETVERAVNSLMKSPGHRRNILNERAKEMGAHGGIGRDGYWFWTQILGTR